MELICSQPDLMHWLGAVTPETLAQHKRMRDHGDLLIRCIHGHDPMFWPWLIHVPSTLTGKST